MGSTQKESYVDVLISGAGPSGMMASLYLSELGINHRIVDKRGTRTLTGRADGFQPRTLEIWESFNLLQHVTNYGPRFGELAMWTFGEDHEGIKRVHRQDVSGAGEFRIEARTLHQGYIEAALGDGVRARGGPVVERGTHPISLRVDETKAANHDDYPITVELRHMFQHELEPAVSGAHSRLSDGTSKAEKGYSDAYGTDYEETIGHVTGEEGTTEVVHAKYLIGTDGAHSWVRHQLPGFRMEGENTDSVFGVIDIIPTTDFPDIRKACAVLSRHGYCLIIPREHNMVRLYVQFPENWSAEGKSTVPNKGDPSICAEIMESAQKILAPYKLESYRYADWWTVYHVGQRVANHNTYLDRVFLAGDAVHTHSPKAGQGMNISSQDSYSFAWKLAGVIHKQLHPSVLSTYEQERVPVARDLIELDKYMAGLLVARAERNQEEVRKMYEKLAARQRTNAGYQPSLIQAADGKEATQSAASGFTLGTRFPDFQVYSQSQGCPDDSHQCLRSNGLWRILVFAGDVSNSSRLSLVNGMGDQLLKLLNRFPSSSPRQSRWAEVYLFHSCRVSAVEINDFHDVYFPPDETVGRKYYQVFGDRPASEMEVCGEESNQAAKGAHEKFGVTDGGALVLVRPDQIVSWVSGLDGLEKMEAWLGNFMLEKMPETQRRDSGREKNCAINGVPGA